MGNELQWAGYKDEGRDKYFSTCGPEVEKWQPFAPDTTWEACETNYFGFSNPELSLQGEVYFWYHPKLGTATGGVCIYQGIVKHQLEALYMDYRTTWPIPKDNTDSEWPNGLRIKMTKPQQEFNLSLDNPADQVSFNVDLKAVTDPIVRYNGNHFVQPMKTSGTLEVRGQKIKIDGYHMRDRSWREPHRTESNLPYPPIGWQTGMFDDDFSFHFMAHENAESRPEWADLYPDLKKAGGNRLWGYIRRGGKTRGIVDLKYFTHRAADNVTPEAFDVVIKDSLGDTHVMKGRVTANLPFSAWHNLMSWWILVRWECDGKVGYGNTQEAIWAAHWRKFVRHPA